MQIRSEKKGNCVTVWLRGELDHHAATQAREQLDALLTPEVAQMIFDCSELGFMDSSGIGVLIGRYKTLAARGGSVSVKNANAQVDKILRMAGMYQILQKK